MIDMKNGVWESGGYTGQQVKAIFMPTLNNHGNGNSDYAGITSAIKSFMGTTEIIGTGSDTVDYSGNTYYHYHGATVSRGAVYLGRLTAYYIQNIYSPVLYITTAMWSGHQSRTGAATETKTVLACRNPATLDYVATKHVISPYASYLDPDQVPINNTRRQIDGCIAGGIGTIDDSEYKVISHSFS